MTDSCLLMTSWRDVKFVHCVRHFALDWWLAVAKQVQIVLPRVTLKIHLQSPRLVNDTAASPHHGQHWQLTVKSTTNSGQNTTTIQQDYEQPDMKT